MNKSVAVGFILGVLVLAAWRLPTEPNWPAPIQQLKPSPKDTLRFELGRRLFYDPLLSADTSVSCGSCHLSYTAFTHVDHALSHGIKDRVGKRNAQPLFNLAWYDQFMWDGAITRLDRQPLAPLLHPDEMGDSLPNILSKLNATPFYRRAFKEAFNAEKIQTEELLQALQHFVLQLVSKDSKYDRMMAGRATFDEQEKRGWALFESHCSSCHPSPLFTSGKFETNGLQPDPKLGDVGRAGITYLASDSFKFRVPSLRNLVWSYPYMHDGRMKTLRQVLNHYSQILPQTQSSHPLKEDRNQTDLLAFLRTLSDTAFVLNPRFAPPRF